MIRPDECPGASGLYGLIPATSTPVLSNCGTTGNLACTFQVDSLSEAVDICNQKNNACWAFTYNSTNGEMQIVSLGGDRTDSTKTDLYIKRVNVVSINSSLI